MAFNNENLLEYCRYTSGSKKFFVRGLFHIDIVWFSPQH